ncbi:DUF3363 domain-containing protein [Ensifer sp. MPMI2T]|nr:DUF3363 domain-containing protein [Ensifer sp. MPMI2T]
MSMVSSDVAPTSGAQPDEYFLHKARRLHFLEHLGLARLSALHKGLLARLNPMLRALGTRSDIIKRMCRALSEQGSSAASPMICSPTERKVQGSSAGWSIADLIRNARHGFCLYRLPHPSEPFPDLEATGVNRRAKLALTQIWCNSLIAPIRRA